MDNILTILFFSESYQSRQYLRSLGPFLSPMWSNFDVLFFVLLTKSC